MNFSRLIPEMDIDHAFSMGVDTLSKLCGLVSYFQVCMINLRLIMIVYVTFHGAPKRQYAIFTTMNLV